MEKTKNQLLIEVDKEEKQNVVHTYLFYDGNHYKIGKSVDVFKRFIAIKSNNINLECVSFCDEDIERELHDVFCKKRISFEWFDLDEDDVNYIIKRFGNPNIEEIKYLNLRIDEKPYIGRYLVSMKNRDEIYWLKSKGIKEYDYWVSNHLRYIGIVDFSDFIKNESSRNYEKILDKINKEENKEKLVQILELTAHKLEVNTISQLARIYDISPNGVKSSKRFRKLFIGKQLMAIPNLRDNNKMPF